MCQGVLAPHVARLPALPGRWEDGACGARVSLGVGSISSERSSMDLWVSAPSLWLLSSEPFSTFCPCHSSGERIATWRSHLGPCPGGGELTKGLPQSREGDIVPECGHVAAGGAEGGSAPPPELPVAAGTVRVPQDISLAMGLIMRVGVLASKAICYCSPWTSRTPLLMGYNLMLPVIVLEKVLIFQTFMELSAHVLPSPGPACV